MKHCLPIISLVLLALLSPALQAQSQSLHFRNLTAKVSHQPDIQLPQAAFDLSDQHYYGLLVFATTPNEKRKQALIKQGVQFSAYLPNNAFYVRMNVTALAAIQRDRADILALVPVAPAFKLSHALLEGSLHSDCFRPDGKVMATMHLHAGADVSTLQNRLPSLELLSNEVGTDAYPIALPADDFQQLASFPSVLFLEEIDRLGEAENFNGRAMARIPNIQSPNGTYYDGSGSVVGHGDDGDIGPHIDYTGRILFNRSGASSGNHGDHVAGTILGGGILDPDGMGMAPGADLVYSSYPSNYTLIDQDYINYNVRITTSSYSNGCNAGYTSTTQQVDNDIIQNPKLMHVYSAGNSGTSDCGYGAGSGWGNITGGHKAGKNVIASANVTSTDAIASSSSRGPASDGRIKPDVAALGSSVFSTIAGNSYASYTGTSMACPGVSGGLAILLEAFKDHNNGQEPDGGLLKAILQNTADDLGNSGPDFTYGFGRMNIERGVALITQGQHLTATISQGGNATHSIPVPTNVAQLKVMVYWTDPAASPSSGRALVNNLNSYLERSGQTWNPWVLNPTPNAAALASAAVRAVDTLNNVEQITIDNPSQGDYLLRVNGASIPQGPQKYYVVYTYLMKGISVDFPSNGVAIEPGQSTIIRWNAPSSSSSFSLTYSLNGGASWSSIGTASATARTYTWTPPSGAATGNALIRITRGTDVATGSPFTLIGQPSGIQFLWTCPDSTHLSWNAVAGATGYQVNMLGARDMDSLHTTSTNSAIVNGVPSGTSVWFSVQAITPQGTLGKRSNGVERSAGIVNCPATCLLSGTVNLLSAGTNFLQLTLSNPLSSAQQYSIEYGPQGFLPGSGTSLSSSTASWVINGLSTSTTYDVYVQAQCSNGSYTNALFGSFTTACATFGLPYLVDMGPASFNCWTTNNPVYVGINSNCPSTGNDELSLWGQAGLYAESPDIITTGQSSLTVSYDYYDPQFSPCGENADAGEQVAIGWVNSSGVFTQMAVYDGGTAPTTPTADQFTINLNGQNSIRIRMQVLSGTSNQFDNWAFDNLLVTSGGTVCAPPTNLTATNISSSSAQLSWTAGNSGSTQWRIEFGPAGFTAGTGTVFNSSSTTYSLFILSANTQYEYFVTETCSAGNQSQASSRYSFTTSSTGCAPITAPYSEDFSSATLGAATNFGNCWTNNNGSGNPLWTAGQGATPSFDTGPLGDHTTGGGIYLFTEASAPAVAGDSILLYSPLIDVSALTTPFLRFYYHMYGQAMGSLHVDVLSGGTWTRDLMVLAGEQHTADTDPYSVGEVVLNGYSGTLQVRFRAVMGPISGISAGSTFYGDIAIDDFSITESPTCFNPQNFSLASVGIQNATLNWSGNQAAYQVQYGLAGFPLGNGTTVNSSANSMILNGLLPSTGYEVYIRSNCGNGNFSNWVGPLSFTTLCSATNLPYLENFNNWPPNCWDLSGGTQTVVQYGGNYLEANFWSWTAGNNAVATTEPIFIHQSARVKFRWSHLYNSNYPDDEMLLLVKLVQSAQWDTLDIWKGPSFSLSTAQSSAPAPDADFVQEVFNLNPARYNGQLVVFQLRFNSGYGPDVFIDDFTVEVLPPCAEPIQLQVGNVAAYQTSLSWTPGSQNATQWFVEYGPMGFAPGNGTKLTSSNTSLTISGLNPASSYTAYVRELCGSGPDTSTYSIGVNWTTACATIQTPYQQNFTLTPPGIIGTYPATILGNCWSLGADTASGPNWETEDASGSDENSLDTGPFYDHTSFGSVGGMYVYLETSTGMSTGPTYLTSPQFYTGTLLQPELHFWYHMYGATIDTLRVDIWDQNTQSWDKGVWWRYGQQQLSGAEAWREAILPLSAYSDTLQIRFMGKRGSSFTGDIALDDITIIEGAPSCNTTYNPVATVQGNYGVNLNWNATSASMYNVWFREVGDTAWVQVNSSANARSISPLAPANYEYYISEAGNANPSCVGNFTIDCEDFNFSSNVLQIVDATGGKVNVFGITGGRRTWDFGISDGVDTTWANNRFSNRFINLDAGTYYFMVRDNYGCYSSQIDTVVIDPLPSYVPTLTSVQNLGGGSLVPNWTVPDPSQVNAFQVRVKDMTGGGVGTLYQTYIANGGGATNFTITGLPPARYRIDVRARPTNGTFADGVYSNYMERIVSNTKSSVRSNESKVTYHGVYLYPNPTKDLLYVQVPESSELVLMDLNGKRIAVRTAKMSEEVFDLRELAQGVYILQISNEGVIHRERVVKQ